MQVYLDYAAATPLDRDVQNAMKPFFDREFYNPSALYSKSTAVKQKLDTARQQIASVVGVRPSEVIFAAGGTEANNLAIQGVATQFPGKHIVYSALEHESVRKPIEWLVQNGWTATEVRPEKDGRMDAKKITKAVTEDTVLVSVMYVNNEIGTIQPIREIASNLQFISEKRVQAKNTLPLYFHTDACQAANYLDIHTHRLGVDLMTLNGGKIYGPKQSGVLIKHANVQLQPLLWGGEQEQNYRSGTENVAGCIGFSTALAVAQDKRKQEAKRLTELQNWFFKEVASKTGKITMNGSQKHRLPNNLHISVSGQDNERLLYALDAKGIMCATGSACSASKTEASHVLLAIGQSEAEARQSLRLTMGRGTTKAKLQYVVNSLLELL